MRSIARANAEYLGPLLDRADLEADLWDASRAITRIMTEQPPLADAVVAVGLGCSQAELDGMSELAKLFTMARIIAVTAEAHTPESLAIVILGELRDTSLLMKSLTTPGDTVH